MPQFDVPVPIANNGTITNIPSPADDYDQSDLIFNPLQYLQYSSWLSTASPSLFTTIDVSIKHNESGANFFITNS